MGDQNLENLRQDKVQRSDCKSFSAKRKTARKNGYSIVSKRDKDMVG